jgi:hypothetical protein
MRARLLVKRSWLWGIAVAAVMVFAVGPAGLASPGDTTLVSVDSAGVQGNGFTEAEAISGDGRFVTFASIATNLVPGDTNNSTDVFIRDLTTGTTERVSVDSGGNQGTGAFGASSVSGDGRYVSFFSDSSSLVAGDSNGVSDIFVRDRTAGITERVSVDSSGGQANAGCSGFGGSAGNDKITPDGRFVVFASWASNLVAGDTNCRHDVFLRDRQAGTTERLSLGAGGVEGDHESGIGYLAITPDARFVAFVSQASNLVASDTNGTIQDLFVRDRLTGTNELISVDSAGNQATFASSTDSPSISADGRFVVFHTVASFEPNDTNGFFDVYLRDRVLNTTTRISLADGGGQANAHATYPAISGDGSRVTFYSAATNLVAGDTNGTSDVFVRDLAAGTTTRQSTGPGGVEGNGSSTQPPEIDFDGSLVYFTSAASNLVANDTNATSDAFLHEVGGTSPPPTPAAVALTPATATNQVGTNHTVTALVTDTNSQPMAGVTVRFTVSGAVSASGSCVTSSTGNCDFTYAGPSVPGTDSIVAYADTNNDGVQQSGEPSGTATKTWTAPVPQLTALSPAHLWLTLNNAVDFNRDARFDVGVELRRNGTLIATGFTRCVTGFAKPSGAPKDVPVVWGSFSPVPINSGDTIALRVAVRTGTNANDTRCGVATTANTSEGLRLYYDAVARQSRFDATITPNPSRNVYLRSNGNNCPATGDSAGVTNRRLAYAAPTATPAKCKRSPTTNFTGGNAWRVIGIWDVVNP